MAAYLYFEFDESPANVIGVYSWGYTNSLGGDGGVIGTLLSWSVADIALATGYTFDTATSEDLGGGITRYRATKNVAEGFDLTDLSQGYIVNLRNYATASVPVRLYDSSLTPPADLTICDDCRNITLQACADSYKIVAGLTLATNYFVTIQDRNNDLYIQEITSDGNGDVTIDATSPEFPAGFWLTESGNKVIKIYADASLEQLEDITVDTTVYSCVLLNLQYYYTTTT